MKYEENNYILTSIEIDEQFVDNASDSYMTDEEREYWIDLEEGMSDEETEEESYQMSDEEQQGFEEHITDEEIEPCDDTTIDNAFNSLFGKKTKETKSIRRANKKALVRNIPSIPTCKFVVNVHEENLNRLANKFNHQGVK